MVGFIVHRLDLPAIWPASCKHFGSGFASDLSCTELYSVEINTMQATSTQS
jgi:hypothetical protein